MFSELGPKLGNLPRARKRAILLVLDFTMLAVALWAAFALRYGEWAPPSTIAEFLVIASAPLVAIPIFIRLGLYRAVIRYLPERVLWTVAQATTLATIVWVVVAFFVSMTGWFLVPRSVPILYWALATLAVGGSRFLAKRILWWNESPGGSSYSVAIYGAGEAGVHLANALRRQRNYRIVAFLDEDRAMHGRDVASIRVFSLSDVPMLVQQYGLQEVVISDPSLPATTRQNIVAAAGGKGIKIRTVPAISDLVSGKYVISQIREIDIDELLGRSSVPPDPNLLREMIKGKTIMVTGAGGSIGSELCRLIIKLAPRQLVLFEANEFALYRIDRELSAAKDCSVVPILGTITDQQRVDFAIGEFGVEVLFHAAAHKHVPLIEANALEGMRNNILGTSVVLDSAYVHRVASVVLISSDKAVRPTNVMGATKRWAELLVSQKAALAARDDTGQHFCSVRFGNVLGSNGSVVPLFQEQIARGGPLTLTDPQMTRYFMSIHEASELIVQAGALSHGGDTFLLDMGEPMLISDLAENMIRIAGHTVKNEANPDGDIEIVITGKRPGEKLFEELFYDDTNVETTRHPKIRRAPKGPLPDVDSALKELVAQLEAQDEVAARKILFSLID